MVGQETTVMEQSGIVIGQWRILKRKGTQSVVQLESHLDRTMKHCDEIVKQPSESRNPYNGTAYCDRRVEHRDRMKDHCSRTGYHHDEL